MLKRVVVLIVVLFLNTLLHAGDIKKNIDEGQEKLEAGNELPNSEYDKKVIVSQKNDHVIFKLQPLVITPLGPTSIEVGVDGIINEKWSLGPYYYYESTSSTRWNDDKWTAWGVESTYSIGNTLYEDGFYTAPYVYYVRGKGALNGQERVRTGYVLGDSIGYRLYLGPIFLQLQLNFGYSTLDRYISEDYRSEPPKRFRRFKIRHSYMAGISF